jgi:RNA polymerase sigma factor (sigma-70 family)
MTSDDASLVRRARRGDRDAFSSLLARHEPLLRRTCRRAASGDDDLAADAAQEAMLTAMLALARLRDDDRFGAWLAGIGLNAVRHLLRDRRAQAPPAPDVAVDGGDPDAALDAAGIAARIRRAIATLPPGQRDAVALYYLAGLTHAEAAEHLGVPPGAVKTRLHKARATLRRRLDPLWKEQFAMSELVPMHVADVRRAAAGQRHVLLLEDEAGERRLPIWVGPPEATTIAGLLEGVELPRPGPYDFAAALLQASGATVKEVRISRLAEATFYADVVLGDGGAIDARPSDAIALALVTGAPLLVDAAVLEQTRRTADVLADEIAEYEQSADDRRVLAAETRERLARMAEETGEIAKRLNRR